MNPNLIKILAGAITAVVGFFALWMAGGMLNEWIVRAIASVAAGGFVWQKVSASQIQKLLDEAKALVK